VSVRFSGTIVLDRPIEDVHRFLTRGAAGDRLAAPLRHRVALELVGEGRGLFRPSEKTFGRYQERQMIPRFLRQLQQPLG
jgi:hypothetical protein